MIAATRPPPRASTNVLIFLGCFLVEELILHLPSYVPALNIPGAGYNWLGKLCALVFIAGALWVFRHRLAPTSAAPGGLRPAILVFLLAIVVPDILAATQSLHHTKTLEDHLFQLTLPGLQEEPAFRWLFLGLLDAAFTRRKNILGAHLGWGAIITSLAFGLAHGLTWQRGPGFSFAPASFGIITYYGLMFCWLRVRTGSVLFAVAAHNASNELMQILLSM